MTAILWPRLRFDVRPVNPSTVDELNKTPRPIWPAVLLSVSTEKIFLIE